MPTGIYTRTAYTPISTRLMRKTLKTSTCWLWQGSKTIFGHGQIVSYESGHRKLVSAHRTSWELTNGPIPNGMCVLHKCDVPNCINPEHLFLGTKADNSKDMTNKNRHKYGESLPQSKLTEQEVIEIRLSSLSQQKLAEKYGVSSASINHIIHNKTWKHLI